MSSYSAPLFDERWRLITMNRSARHFFDVPESRFFAWVEIHSLEHLTTKPNYEWHLEWLRRPHPFPILMQRRFEEFPASVRFQLEIEAFLPRAFYASSFDYAIAYSLCAGARELSLWGLERESDLPTEPQRMAALAYWIGIAEGLGVKVTAPAGCKLTWVPRG